MFIPLDNLYDWISSTTPGTIIYRFLPHGSKKLEDITPLDDRSRTQTPWEIMRQVTMLCHDQEPLDFDRHANLDWQYVRDLVKHKWTFVAEPKDADSARDFWQDRASYNMACMVNHGINDRVLLLHSETNSTEVNKYNNSKFVTAYWWSHAMIALDWYRFARYDNRLEFNNLEYQFDFNIYSRAWTGTREYRLFFLQQLARTQLHPHSRITFSGTDGLHHYTRYQFKNTALAITDDLSNLEETTNVASSSSATYNVTHYQQCAIDVVLETMFDDNRCHLTEKILRPIACGKPFILVSTPGTLGFLRKYKFETFAPWIDESYDSIQDPVERIAAIINSMQIFADLGPDLKQHHLIQMQEVADRNKQHFFSDAFAQHIKDELTTNIDTARKTILDSYQTGASYRANRLRMSSQDKKRLASDSNRWHASSNVRKEIAKLLRECRSRLGR